MSQSKSRAKSYAEYLAALNEQTAKTTEEAVAAAIAERKTANATYGATGEKLARQNLVRSGYASYLTDAAKAASNAKIASLNAVKEKAENKNLAGYADYLAENKAAARAEAETEEAARRKTVNSLLTSIVKNRTPRTEAVALTYAAGLSEKDANFIGDFAELCRKSYYTQDQLNDLIESYVTKG